MKRVFLYISVVFALLGCGAPDGYVRLEGEFNHLQQGEFYIYSTDGGTRGFDTLRLERGVFKHEMALKDSATFILLYPNLSELVVFAYTGDVISIKGDARSLSTVEVTGNEANELMTEFRLENNGKGEQEVREAAAAFIASHPNSPVSIFLFRKYFLQNDAAPVQEVKEIFQTLITSQPNHYILNSWRDDVDTYAHPVQVGDTIPDFSFYWEKDSAEITYEDFRGKYLLINFWASWETYSGNIIRRLKRLRKEYPGEFENLSVSLDASRFMKRRAERRDSVDWISICDEAMWDGSMVRMFDVREIPYFILVGPDRKVIATGNGFEGQIMPELNKILKKE